MGGKLPISVFESLSNEQMKPSQTEREMASIDIAGDMDYWILVDTR